MYSVKRRTTRCKARTDSPCLPQIGRRHDTARRSQGPIRASVLESVHADLVRRDYRMRLRMRELAVSHAVVAVAGGERSSGGRVWRRRRRRDGECEQQSRQALNLSESRSEFAVRPRGAPCGLGPSPRPPAVPEKAHLRNHFPVGRAFRDVEADNAGHRPQRDHRRRTPVLFDAVANRSSPVIPPPRSHACEFRLHAKACAVAIHGKVCSPRKADSGECVPAWRLMCVIFLGLSCSCINGDRHL